MPGSRRASMDLPDPGGPIMRRLWSRTPRDIFIGVANDLSPGCAVTTKAKAYSYLRFSTPEQAQGDSHRRQTRMAQDYALRHGLELDEELTFNDLGVSAFRGKNAEVGALRAFLIAVENEQIPSGSYLLVESLDRISRQSARKASRILEEIVEAGVVLVTLSDGKHWTTEAIDSFDWIMANVLLFRGNEESAMKSKRLKAAWRSKRDNVNVRPLTGCVPAWLLKDDETLRVREDRAAIVRRIYEEAAAGDGPDLIARRLNRDDVPVFGYGRQWHRSYVAKILDNDAVVGVLTPHTLEYIEGKRTRVPLDPIPDYYPAVIDWALYQRVRDRRGSATRQAGPSSLHNVFARLTHCGRCGGTVTHVNKGQGRGQGRYLVCSAAKTGVGCKYESVRYDMAEERFLFHGPDLIRHAPAGIEIDEEIEDARRGIMGLEDLLFAGAHGQTQVALKAAEAELRTLIERAEVVQGKLVRKRLDALLAAAQSDPLNRRDLNAALRAAVEKIVLDFDAFELVLHWRHGGESRCAFSTAAYGFSTEPRKRRASSNR
jgi:DNA invertase Pin-like site-specific DNA recombinase